MNITSIKIVFFICVFALTALVQFTILYALVEYKVNSIWGVLIGLLFFNVINYWTNKLIDTTFKK
jgi:hypothetical protein